MSVFDSTVVDMAARGATGGALPAKGDSLFLCVALEMTLLVLGA